MSNPPAEPVRTDELRLDAQNPWPGLTAFKEQQQDFFFGRKEEASELFSCIKRERITVLFGKSGLGKTSLLQAGLFPQLRHASFLPIYIRLSYAEGAPSLESQMQAAFEGAIKSADLAEVASAQPGESIWEYLHRRGGNLINYEGGVVTPVLVFDQFEEWFTLGSRKDFMFRLSEEFLPRLTDLIENRTPRALTEKLTQNRELARRYDLEAPGCRILITLREDYLANLENLRDAMPSLVFVDNRMRLTEMNGRQAFAVVSEPNPELVDSDVAGFIVRFVAGAHADGLDGKVRTGDTTLEHLEIAPAILSLFCRQLNQERLKQNLSGITRKLVTAQGVTIIDDFYKQSIADMHPAVRRLIEDRLLTKAGYRDNIDLAQARTDLEQAGANSSCLDDLVRLRLLQVEEHRGLPRLELTHDVLADPVKRSRDQWDREQVREKQRQQEREALAQAKQAEQVAVRKARFLQRVIATITLVSVLLAALLVYALKKRSEAQTSEKGEKQAVLDAEQAKAKAERAQTDAERAKADADQAKLAKAEADALTIKQKDGELQMFRQHEADRNSLANVSLNSLEHCLSIANYFLRLGQEKKSQAWLEVYESFLMEGDQCFGLAQTVHKLMPENLEITDDLITIPLNAAESARLRADKKKVREYCDSAVNEADRLQNERKDRGTKILAARTYVAAASKLAEVGDETAKAKDDQGMSVVAELRARSTLKDFGDRDWHNLGAVYSYHGDFLTSSKKDPEAIQSYKESFNAEVNAHTRKPRDKAKDKEYEAAALKLAITIGDYEKRLGDNDAAMQWYEKTPKFAHESDDRAKIAHVYSDMRTALIGGKKYDEAHAFIDRRIHSLATDPLGPSRERDLAMAYGDAAEVEEARRWWPQAVDYRARAVTVLAPVKTDDAYVGVRKDLAIAYRDLSWAEIFAGQVEKGLADTRKGIAVAEEIAEEIRDHSTVVPLHENNMDARLRSAVANNSRDDARDPDGVTQKPAKESKDRSILGLVYTDAITVLSANEHYDEAHQLSDQYLAALLKEPQDVQRDRQLAAAYGRAAGIEENRKQWPLAVDYRGHAVMVLAALKTNAYEGVSKDLAIAYSVLSWDDIYAGQVEKGLADAQEGIAGAEETLDHFTLGDVYANAIRPLVANKRYSDARNLSDRLFQTLLKEPQDLERDWALQAAYGDSVRIDQVTEDWPRAVEDYKQQVAILTALNEKYTYEIIQKDLASAYGGLSWAEIQAGRFAEGRDDAKRGLAKDPTQTWINVKLAHGLLLTGKGSDARDLYLKIKDYPHGNNTLLADIAGDFKQLCKLGKAPPEMLSIAHDLGINDPELSKCSASVAGAK